jgi:XTP/dITP diphosphohydrolase
LSSYYDFYDIKGTFVKSLLIATTNQGKRLEIQEILQFLPFQLVFPADIGLDMDVLENGDTYAENATLKAIAYCQVAHLLTLADDSGLEVDALNGAPGLHSARYTRAPISRSGAPPFPSSDTSLSTQDAGLFRPGDAERRALLLANLRLHPRPWTARFTCTVAIAIPGDSPIIHLAEGECRGEIIPEERGSNGFGYDPIFFIPETNCTMAELEMAKKNQISHRARAILAAEPLLRRLAV